MEEQILITVNEDGTVEVYWHDPSSNPFTTQPKVSVLYESDRGCEQDDVQAYVKDFDEVLESDCTYQIE
jgi:hypothetical protein